MKFITPLFLLLLLGFQQMNAQSCGFNFSPNRPVCPDETQTFNASTNFGPNPSFEWNFGDGTTANGQSTSHSYPFNTTPRNYQVVLTVDTNNVVACRDTQVVSVNYQPEISFDPFNANIQNCSVGKACNSGFTANFDFNSGPAFATLTPLFVDFGDGNDTLTNSPVFTHTYQTFGSFPIVVRASGSSCPLELDRARNFTRPDDPTLNIPPLDFCEGDTAFIEFSLPVSCPENVDFYRIYWDYANNPGDFEDVDTVGTYTNIYDFIPPFLNSQVSPEIRVEAINSCGYRAFKQSSLNVYVVADPGFTYSPDPACWPLDSQLTFIPVEPSVSISEIGHLWTFGNPASGPLDTSTLVSPTHTYPGPDTFFVTHTVTHTVCKDNVLSEPVVIGTIPEASISAFPLIGCEDLVVDFSNASTPLENVSYQWRVSGGGNFVYTQGNDTSREIQITFRSPGQYNVLMEIFTPECGSDTASVNVTVQGPPRANLLPLPDTCGAVSLQPGILGNVNENFSPLDSVVWDFGPNASPASFLGQAPPSIAFTPVPGSPIRIISATFFNECGATVVRDTFNLFDKGNVSGGADSTLCVDDSAYCLVPNPGGGNWTLLPGGMAQSSFCYDPSLGSGQVLYVIDTLGCSFEDTVFINVNPLPVISANDFAVCVGDTVDISLLSGVSPGGGIWTGPNVIGNSLYEATQAGQTDTLFYVYFDPALRCENVEEVLVFVNDLPAVDAGADTTFCLVNADQQLAQPFLSPTGGNGFWSGPGVTDSIQGLFNPSLSTDDTVRIYFTYTDLNGCRSQDSFLIFIVPPVPADAQGDRIFCKNDPGVVLPTLSGGSWTSIPSGNPGLLGGSQFDPFLANSNFNSLVYTLNPGNSCESRDTVVYTVLDTAVLSGGASDTVVCENTPPFLLRAFPTGGIWRGQGIVNGSTGLFDPDSLAINQLTRLTYEYVDGSSSNNCVSRYEIRVRLRALPNVVIAPDSQIYCQTSAIQDLPVANPMPGTWFGKDSLVTAALVNTNANPGVPGTFDPSVMGVDTLFFYYEYSDGFSCRNVDSVAVIVVPPLLADAGKDDSLCLNSGIINLGGLPNGGSWSGPGVNMITGDFDPLGAGVGTHQLVYCFGVGSCFNCDTVMITVQDTPSISVLDETFCVGSGPVSLEDNGQFNGVLAGGTWSGGGVFFDTALNESLFDTLVAGSYLVEFTYTDSINTVGCVSRSRGRIQVDSLPLVDAGEDTTLCLLPGEVCLNPAFPAGGFWSGGAGLSDTLVGCYTPTLSGVGSETIYYTSTNGLGCTNRDSMVITVVEPDSVSAGLSDTVCENEGSFLLSGFYPPVGQSDGRWSGPGMVVSDSGRFDPGLAGDGTFTLIYCTGVLQCEVCDSISMRVEAPPPLTALADSLCANDAPVSLSDNGLAYGSLVSGEWVGAGVSQLPSGEYIFANDTPGVYTVQFIYTDSIFTQGCSNEVLGRVEVFSIPEADFPTPADACTNVAANFTSSSLGANRYFWDFGDPNSAADTSILANASYTYTDTGRFVITHIALNANQCVDTTFDTIFVSEPPFPNFIDGVDSACSMRDILPGLDGIAVDIQDLSNPAGGSYFWDFGGGRDSMGNGSSTSSSPPRIFFPQGVNDTTYYISLTISNFCSSLTFVDSVAVRPIPRSIFGPQFSTFCSPYIPVWSNNSTGSPTSFSWYVDDFSQLVSTDSLPTNIVLSYSGSSDTTYEVILVVENSCGSDTSTQPITVLPNTVDAFFNTSARVGCAPFTVTFRDFSFQDTTNFDFGDGSGITTQDTVTHTFSNPGTYIVQHYASNFCSSDTDTVIITVLPYAELAIVPDDTLTCPGQPISFRDTAGMGNAVGYIWDMGNGDTLRSNSPTYTYNQAGTYQIILSANTISNSCTGRDTSRITVRGKPQAQFTADVFSGCAPLQVNFTNQTPGNPTYFWAFGDSNFSPLRSPVHVFEEAGSYEVVLTAFDSLGCEDRDSLLIQVNPKPEANFDLFLPDSCGAPVNVSFTNTSSGNQLGYCWNFGNDTSKLTDPDYTYTQAGSYQVELIAETGLGCKDTLVKSLTIFPQPEAAWTFTPDQGCGPLNVVIEQNSTNFTDSYVNFRPGVDSVNPNFPLDFTYFAGADDANYTATLVVSFDDKCFDSLSQQISVFSSPQAAFTASWDSICGGGNTLEVSSQSVDNRGISSHFYDFGDPASGPANTSIDSVALHTYESPGSYTLTHIVSDINGCSDTATRVIEVFPRPRAAIGQDVEVGCYSLPVSFYSAQSPDNATGYQWSFGDGGRSRDSATSYTYDFADTFEVRLVLDHQNFCFDTAYAQMAVGDPPKADFLLDIIGECQDTVTVLTTNTSVNATEYLWQFESNISSNEFEPVAQYSFPDDYDISLIVSNDFECRDTLVQSFLYPRAIAAFSFEQDGNCSPSEVRFINESIGANEFTWDFGDGNILSDTVNPVYTYREAGEYRVALYVSYFGVCRDTFIFPAPISIKESPEVAFDHTRLTGRLGVIRFLDQSPRPGENFFWDFGDGSPSIEREPQKVYNENPSLICDCTGDSARVDSDYYRVILTHTNNNGCLDRDTAFIHPHIHGLEMPNAIIPSGPNPDNAFQAVAVGLCKLHLSLYDTWGNKVWEWNSDWDIEGYGFDENGRPLPTHNWDGSIKDLPASRQSLLWRIHDIQFTGCQIYDGPTQGKLTVIR